MPSFAQEQFMNKAAFWKLIDASREDADGDLDGQVANLRAKVEQLDSDEIVQFGKLFAEYSGRAYTWDLWAAAYILGGGCSDDGFQDFRGWLISRGERVYTEALRDPEILAQVVNADAGDECQYEGFQYVAREAWQNKTRSRLGDFPITEITQPDKPAGEPWSEEGDDLKRRFPKLWRKFAARSPRRIRIVATPPGEAPPSIRAAWIGCVLPLVSGTDSPEFGGASQGVVSRRSVKAYAGYGVPARDALLILEQHDAAAAQWWREHAPRLLEPGKVLVFAADMCELLNEDE
jgi:uncharacterized protein DUF4240